MGHHIQTPDQEIAGLFMRGVAMFKANLHFTRYTPSGCIKLSTLASQFRDPCCHRLVRPRFLWLHPCAKEDTSTLKEGVTEKDTHIQTEATQRPSAQKISKVLSESNSPHGPQFRVVLSYAKENLCHAGMNERPFQQVLPGFIDIFVEAKINGLLKCRQHCCGHDCSKKAHGRPSNYWVLFQACKSTWRAHVPVWQTRISLTLVHFAWMLGL